MNNYFDYRLTHDRMKLEFSNSVVFSEREIHSYHEILYCECQGVTLCTENGQTEICGKRIFVIPRGKYHLFDLSGEKQFIRLKISIPEDMTGGIPLELFSGEIRVLHPSEFRSAFLIDRLIELIKDESYEARGRHAYFATMFLLAELDGAVKRCEDIDSYGNNHIVPRVIEYISKNLSADLSITELSRALNFSPSFISHKFREKMGISLHRYILQKRMAYAKGKIEDGERPTKIYRECGYRDYSSFYKAYLRYFSTPPSERE